MPSTEPGRPAGLTDVIDAVRPTALIGLSTATGAFTEQVVRRMATHVKRPIIMPLSNPTSRSEARPQDLADWTQGRALVATGSPFPPMQAGRTRIPVAQCNNIYIFPGIGLAVTAVHATRVTDAIMTAAAAVSDAATSAATKGGAEHIEALAQRYLGAPYPWYGGRDQVRVILTITADKIHRMG